MTSTVTSLITRQHCDQCESLNRQLAEEILQLDEEKISRKTHFFAGRYENIYVDKHAIEGLATLVEQALSYAAEILQRNVDELKIGFWINIMYQGHTTTLHRHDDSDELLSCVYYLKVPQGCGQFVYHHNGEKHFIEPREADFLFFSPSLLHEVTEHQPAEARISIAFNIGPVEPEDDE